LLVPVTVTVYEPAVPLQERLDVPEVPRVTLADDRLQDRPVEGETEADRATVPVKPCRLATVIVEVPDVLTRTVRLVGLAVTVKSCIV